MMNEATREFILRHREDDVRRLALKGAGRADVDMPLALQQIAGWQTARKKLPTWAAVDGILYPPHLNMEQCSSEQTARYKAQIVGRPPLNPPEEGLAEGDWGLVDLTGGFGVDFYFMAHGANRPSLYVEQNPELCEIARHNFQVLGLECSVVCGTAADVLQRIGHAACIYLDPARRDEHGGRTYALEDCTPNVLELLPLLSQKADRIIIKLSPMLDWHCLDLNVNVNDNVNLNANPNANLNAISREVHIVSVGNECKELLLVLGVVEPPPVGEGWSGLFCVNDDQVWQVPQRKASPSRGRLEGASSGRGRLEGALYLYEPNASIMKAGCFDELADYYQVGELSANSHLFVSDRLVSDFPGRSFRIERTTSLNKKELKQALQDIDRANISVRNFPMSVEALRQRLRLKDGGDVYIFATTTADGSRQLFICRKIAK
ncbi:MAG: SAM-dependent methyltransferase [Prevotella sp.]|nr:SAM-dependent methyltransferase [Prevotella sp.]